MNISLTNVSAGYGKDNLIIKNINHEFNEGGVWGILGPNGAGKTTLLRVLAGILPYSGKATLLHSNSVKENSESKDATESFEIAKTSHKELAKYIAMMPQFSSIYFSYTIYDAVLMGRYAHRGNGLKDALGSATQADMEAADKALEITGLSDIKDKELNALSGGQLQRVLLARTIAQETPIILLDEPTNHLDFKFHTELLDYLKKWSAGETQVSGITHKNTVISVFHDIGAAALIADSILLMKDGAIIKEGSTQDVLTRNLLEEIYDTDIVSYYSKIYESLPL